MLLSSLQRNPAAREGDQPQACSPADQPAAHALVHVTQCVCQDLHQVCARQLVCNEGGVSNQQAQHAREPDAQQRQLPVAQHAHKQHRQAAVDEHVGGRRV
jgi:hypothetical protein